MQTLQLLARLLMKVPRSCLLVTMSGKVLVCADVIEAKSAKLAYVTCSSWGAGEDDG